MVHISCIWVSRGLSSFIIDSDLFVESFPIGLSFLHLRSTLVMSAVAGRPLHELTFLIIARSCLVETRWSVFPSNDFADIEVSWLLRQVIMRLWSSAPGICEDADEGKASDKSLHCVML